MAQVPTVPSEVVVGRSVAALLGAGILAELAFALLGLAVAPLLLGVALQPALLIAALAERLAHQEMGYGAAFILHFLAGAVLFPVAYRVLFRRAAERRWLSAGLAWGLALWLFSQGLLAPLAGKPFLSDFGVVFWLSGAVHLVYTLVLAATYPRLKAWMTRPLDRPAA